MMLTIYSKEGCPYCDKFIAVCELENLPHVVYKLDKEFTQDQFNHVFGEGSKFPQIQLDRDGEDRVHLGGASDSITFLQEKQLCCTV